MKEKHKHAYMKTAEAFAECSTAQRLKVGAIIVKEDRVISIGYNGMPVGWDNVCENKEYMDPTINSKVDPNDIKEAWPFEEEVKGEEEPLSNTYKRLYRLKTKPEVLHAESNAIAKVARSTESSENASLFCTHAPCIDCAKLIYQAGITEVIYKDQYRSTEGIEFLQKCGVNISQIKIT